MEKTNVESNPPVCESLWLPHCLVEDENLLLLPSNSHYQSSLSCSSRVRAYQLSILLTEGHGNLVLVSELYSAYMHIWRSSHPRQPSPLCNPRDCHGKLFRIWYSSQIRDKVDRLLLPFTMQIATAIFLLLLGVRLCKGNIKSSEAGMDVEKSKRWDLA